MSFPPKHCGCPCTLTFLYSIPITKQALASFSSIFFFFTRCPRSTWFRFDAELLRVILRRVKYLLILSPGRPRRAESRGIIKGVGNWSECRFAMLLLCERDCKIERFRRPHEFRQKRLRCRMIVLTETIVLWPYDQICRTSVFLILCPQRLRNRFE